MGGPTEEGVPLYMAIKFFPIIATAILLLEGWLCVDHSLVGVEADSASRRIPGVGNSAE